MKPFLPLLFLTLLISTHLFSQNKIGQIAYAQWDTEAERWNYYSFDNWTYDEQEREETFYHRNNNYSDYTPTNNLNSLSKYDAAGNLIEKTNYHFGPFESYNEFNQYSYDADNELTEQLVTWTYSNHENVNQQKYIFEKDENEKRRTTKIFEKDFNGNFFLRSQQDSFLTIQNCLKEERMFNFYPDGEIQYGRIWEMEYGADCQLLSSHFSRWNVVEETMQEFDKYIYEYSNDGKTMVITYSRYNQNNNQWELQNLSETEYNDQGQKVRYFAESFNNNFIDSMLLLYSYTPKNEIEVFQKYETRNFQDGRHYRRIENDSFSYHYDLEDRIILKEEFRQYYENSITKYTSTFEYYCNGQIKSEIYAVDYPYSRKDYRYDGGVDCPLDDDEKVLLLFPNPTSGVFTIQSNMLSSATATIQVFTILGQEIFSKKIDQMSYQYQLDLSNFGKGNYIIVVSNEEKRTSEKVIIF